MRQRVIIALALLFNPRLLLADEPTTGLDVIVQKQVLEVLKRLQAQHEATLIFVSHDIGVVADLCRRIAVMYAGEIVEYGATADVLATPMHPYAIALKQSFPDIRHPERELVSIPGRMPALFEPPSRCTFAERCPFARERCRNERPLLALLRRRPARGLPFRGRSGADAFDRRSRRRLAGHGAGMSAASSLLVAEGIGKTFTRRHGLTSFLARDGDSTTRALDDVSLRLERGRVLGIVGESGSGKSTLANLILGLETPSEGQLSFAGRDIARFGGKELKAFRRQVQMVFQDPQASLDPRFSVGRSVEEPLVIHGVGNADDRRRRVQTALEETGLAPAAAFLDRLPHELSGGQRQRVAIARAIILEPTLLIADEPVSMLDVSVRAGILKLLRRLVQARDMAMVFITHDLSIISYICDELAILYRGELVEHGPAIDVMSAPKHEYTRQLISAVPVPEVQPPPPSLEGTP